MITMAVLKITWKSDSVGTEKQCSCEETLFVTGSAGISGVSRTYN